MEEKEEQKLHPDVLRELDTLGFTNVTGKTPEDLLVYFAALNASRLRKVCRHTGLLYALAIAQLIILGISILLYLFAACALFR